MHYRCVNLPNSLSSQGLSFKGVIVADKVASCSVYPFFGTTWYRIGLHYRRVNLRQVYLHTIWVVTVLLLFPQLLTAAFTHNFELIDEESNFTGNRMIHCIVYLHNIWQKTVLLLFIQFPLQHIPLFETEAFKELNFTVDILLIHCITLTGNN